MKSIANFINAIGWYMNGLYTGVGLCAVFIAIISLVADTKN